MRKLLYGSEHLDNYVDDVLAHTPTWTDHLLSMRDFLIRMRNAHLTLRPSKCSVGFSVCHILDIVGNQTLQTKSSTASKVCLKMLRRKGL